MLQAIFRVYSSLVSALLTPVLIAPLLSRTTGQEYGIGLKEKLRLLRQMRRNTRAVQSASHFLEHVAMATHLLRVPKRLEGDLVECGCFKGGSTTNLSLLAAACGRRLQVFDSFAGLPEPTERDRAHLLVDLGTVHTYARGAFCGTLEEVKGNVGRWGRLDVCDFHVGYFADSMPHYQGKCVFVFLDVDLTSSLETCLEWLWPKLQDGCPLFTHEAPHHEIAAAFYDRGWWRERLGCEPPGLVGAGNGLGLVLANGTFRSDLGYTVKNANAAAFEVCPQIAGAAVG